MESPAQLGRTSIARRLMQDEWVPDLHCHLICKAVPGQVIFRDEKDYQGIFANGALRRPAARLQQEGSINSAPMPAHLHAPRQ